MLIYFLAKKIIGLCGAAKIPYSRLFSRGKIFTNFTNQIQFVKILPSKYLSFSRYSKQSVMILENFALENNPLYGNILIYTYVFVNNTSVLIE